MTLDLQAIVSGLFLPLLMWTGSVIAISLMGYPGVVCMTPAFWALAFPVGIRVRRESTSSARGAVIEAAVGGAVLGAWQGLLLAAIMDRSHWMPGGYAGALPSPYLVGAAAALLGAPVTAGLAALVAWKMEK